MTNDNVPPLSEIPPKDYELYMAHEPGKVAVALYLTNQLAASFQNFVDETEPHAWQTLMHTGERNPRKYHDDAGHVWKFLEHFAEMIKRSYEQFPVQRLRPGKSLEE